MRRLTDEEMTAYRATLRAGRGGRVLLRRYGPEYFRQLGRLGALMSNLRRMEKARHAVEEFPEGVLERGCVNLQAWQWAALREEADAQEISLSALLRALVERSMRQRGWSSATGERVRKG